jgi:hypothetical protein
MLFLQMRHVLFKPFHVKQKKRTKKRYKCRYDVFRCKKDTNIDKEHTTSSKEIAHGTPLFVDIPSVRAAPVNLTLNASNWTGPGNSMCEDVQKISF